MYDFFIWSLTVVGILGIVVFSYKMAHSRGYPIGIVRRPHASQAITGQGVVLDEFQHPDVQTYFVETEPRTATMNYFGVSDEPPRRVFLQSWPQSKKPVGKVVIVGQSWPQSKIPAGKVAIAGGSGWHYAHFNPPPQEPPGESALEKRVAERLEDLEKRMRRLEVQSMVESQESSEDKPQSPKTETIH